MTTHASSSTADPTSTLAPIFSQVTTSLLQVGATPVLAYLSHPRLALGFPTSNVHQPAHSESSPGEFQITRAVARIHQACQNTFGSVEALKFEWEDDAVGEGKRCHLTITRPNGESRSYTSPTSYAKKYDSKASVCTFAIQAGAIEFILSGKGDISPSNEGASDTPLEMDESVKAIEQSCLELTEGKVTPYWLNINEPKFGQTMGCALRIRLGPRNTKVYSVDTVHKTPADAKKACAETALAEGVMEYLKTWTPPSQRLDPEDIESPISLQQFFESLPQPFPESSPGQSAMDINGPAWLNQAIQAARGGKIAPKFIWTINPMLNLHGCLLRLERPGEVKSYLVDARFAKRMEAKAAVCLLAMSEGVGDYLRALSKAVEDKLPHGVRRHVNEVLLPTLMLEYRKARGPGSQPTFDYETDADACGATLILELNPNPNPQQVQKYTVPAEYRNRNDAKIAVVHRAVEQGAIEFLRFRGQPPPPGYVPHFTRQEPQPLNRKRKAWDSAGGFNGGGGPSESWGNAGYNAGPGGWQQNKKQRIGGGGFNSQGNFLGPPSLVPSGGQGPGQPGFGGGHQNGSKPSWNGSKRFTPKRPYAPGPGQHGGTAGHPMPPFQPGFRTVGGFSGPQQNAPYSPQSLPTSTYPFPPANGPTIGVAQHQAVYPGAGPTGLHNPLSFQPQIPLHPPPVTPYGGSSVPSVTGGVSHPHFPSAQIPQQHPYSIGTGLSSSSAPQAPAYQPFAAVHPQTHQPGYFPPPTQYSSPMISTSSYLPGTPQPPSLPTMQVNTSPNANGAFMYSPLGNQRRSSASSIGPLHPASVSPTPPPPTVVPPPPPASAPPPPPPTQTISSNKKTRQMESAKPARTASSPITTGGKVVIRAPAKTNVTELYDYCSQAKLPPPQWCHEILKGDRPGAEPKHKVWVVIGKTKYELPLQFGSLSQGQEKVARKVLDQYTKKKEGLPKADANTNAK